MIFIFFVIALVYSSAGFGGGSMYISVLSQVTPMTSAVLRLHALICNAIVTGQGILQWKRALDFPKEGVGILLSAAIPCAIAVFFPLTETYFLKTLGFALLLAGISMLLQERFHKITFSMSTKTIYLVSAFIGVLAGLTGIGGGIYLSPMLHLSNWGDAKRIASISAWFIFTNSIISIVIMLFKGFDWGQLEWSWMLAVLLGGLIGSSMSISWFQAKHIRWLTAILLIFAAIRVLCK
jgi:uncharacterized protein